MRRTTANWVIGPLWASWIAVGFTGPARASEELARDKRCLGCHAIDAKRVGPSFKDVAKRYGAQPAAAPVLARKVIEGGAGNWGPVPMTANGQVNDADAKRLVAWILSLK